MEWIDHFQLFLFDFDGLLVNTEKLHYLAYKQMCHQRGFSLPWSFNLYCSIAHYTATALRDRIYQQFPALHEQEPDWRVLYSEKQTAVVELINQGVVDLMPGVEPLLQALERKGIKRCVVTHSADVLVHAIRKHSPLLETIPHWITRHDYTYPKPHPEPYLKAIEKFAVSGDKIIGFEDTPRGLSALLETPVKAVLISTINYPETPSFLQKGAVHFSSFEDIPSNWI